MTKDEVKKLCGSLSAVADVCGITPQAVSQWFDKGGNLMKSNGLHRTAIIGAAVILGKQVPTSWVESSN